MSTGRDSFSSSHASPASGSRPPKIDPTVPHPVRMYDYMLGGKDNFEADRKAAEATMALSPAVRQSILDNRAFLGRAVRHLSRAGITQFLDIGTGLPSQGNVHEVAQEINPAARVVYVDNDPVVMAHARALLTSTSPEGKVAYVQADLREPDVILGHPEVRATLDFDRPIALLLVGMLMYIQNSEEPHRLVGRLTEALPSGSHLVLSHVSSDLMPPPIAQALVEIYSRSGTPFTLRTGEEITRFFDGMELVDPGLVKVFRWRPDEHEHRGPGAPTGTYAGVGRKP